MVNYVQLEMVYFYTIDDKSNVCKYNKYPDLETLQDIWYKVLAILFSLSWNLTGYAIQGTSYFIFPILEHYRICDTRY